ncbi:MAG: hypothetical protein QN173_08395 [Armatimonadota bacterium]|nr:hypothetical protein [Armatimonadota bacterium]MDR7400849.1 hypothetical protein [Armatimonadota bacterium]MDR7404694.1 hypothetical protein [Armatimonadota bacterium]MDR7437805.1 hypothetical protein [Armatimonadota bacterium]MDR7473130.1 hypothetical protein [Armatimonadota bacterium]
MRPTAIRDRAQTGIGFLLTRRTAVRVGVPLLAAAATSLILALSARPTHPRPGDHWRARYLIVICGRPVADLPRTSGPVYTDGDGVIHVAPRTAAEGGSRATLGRFFASAGMRFSRDEIVFPDGTAYRSGDRCPDGAVGQVRLLVNGRPSREFDRYVPHDGDAIVIQFGASR